MNTRIKSILLALSALLLCCNVSVYAQEREEPDLEEIAENEADRLERLLDLEPWQTFYVDSTLKHNYAAMMDEVNALRNSKVSNGSMYQDVQDKWYEAIDASYKKIFTAQQWALYLKSGAERAQKARAKRREKAAASLEKKK
ncbi:MAG: hypothetical protein MJY67_05015 [Bacteroidales bacterium]|nr:hypothetical protein [Bacteroidales bacterium]